MEGRGRHGLRPGEWDQIRILRTTQGEESVETVVEYRSHRKEGDVGIGDWGQRILQPFHVNDPQYKEIKGERSEFEASDFINLASRTARGPPWIREKSSFLGTGKSSSATNLASAPDVTCKTMEVDDTFKLQQKETNSVCTNVGKAEGNDLSTISKAELTTQCLVVSLRDVLKCNKALEAEFGTELEMLEDLKTKLWDCTRGPSLNTAPIPAEMGGTNRELVVAGSISSDLVSHRGGSSVFSEESPSVPNPGNEPVVSPDPERSRGGKEAAMVTEISQMKCAFDGRLIKTEPDEGPYLVVQSRMDVETSQPRIEGVKEEEEMEFSSMVEVMTREETRSPEGLGGRTEWMRRKEEMQKKLKESENSLAKLDSLSEDFQPKMGNLRENVLKAKAAVLLLEERLDQFQDNDGWEKWAEIVGEVEQLEEEVETLETDFRSFFEGQGDSQRTLYFSYAAYVHLPPRT